MMSHQNWAEAAAGFQPIAAAEPPQVEGAAGAGDGSARETAGAAGAEHLVTNALALGVAGDGSAGEIPSTAGASATAEEASPLQSQAIVPMPAEPADQEEPAEEEPLEGRRFNPGYLVAATRAVRVVRGHVEAAHGFLAPVEEGELLIVLYIGAEGGKEQGWAYARRSRRNDYGWILLTSVPEERQQQEFVEMEETEPKPSPTD